MIIAAVVETRHAGHQSMSEAEGSWGGGWERGEQAVLRTGRWFGGRVTIVGYGYETEETFYRRKTQKA